MNAPHTVLVTRPRAQGADLCARLRTHGVETRQVPVLEIAVHAVPDGRIEQLARADLLVFVSLNAAEAALPWLDRYPPPQTAQYFAVGKTTAQFFDRHLPPHRARDSRTHFPPRDMNSEGLLALPELQADKVRGKQVVILRGDGGRELIAETLAARGACVDSVSLYRRCVPHDSATALRDALPQCDIVQVNSGESLDNLLALYDAGASGAPRELLLAKTLVVPGQRVALAAQKKGFRHILVAENATDEAMVTALSGMPGG